MISSFFRTERSGIRREEMSGTNEWKHSSKKQLGIAGSACGLVWLFIWRAEEAELQMAEEGEK